MSQSSSKFAKLLESSLSTMANNSLYLMINSAFFKYKGKMVIARYKTDDTFKGIQVGYFVSINNQRIFKEDAALFDELETMATSKKLFGLDFSQDIPDSYPPTITIHGGLRVLEIKSPIFETLFQTVYNNPQREIVRFPNSGRVLTDNEIISLNANFDDYMFEAYLTSMNDRFYKLITSPKNGSLVFYSQLESFVPLFVSGPCLYNPLTQNHRYKELITNSQLYKVASFIEKDYNGLVINFITHKEICKALGLSNFTKMPFRFALQIVFGFLKPQYPNKNSYSYVRTTNDESLPIELSEEDYAQLPSEYKPDYRRFNTLFTHCYRYRITVGAPNENELYRIVEPARLVV